MPNKPFIFMICITMSIRKANTEENTFITITNKTLRSSSNCSLLCYQRMKINHGFSNNSPARQKKKKKNHKNTQKKQKAAPWRKTFPSAILWKSQKQPHIIFIWRKGNKEMNRSNKFPLNPNYWFISLVNIQSVSHVTHNHIILIPECQHYI